LTTVTTALNSAQKTIPSITNFQTNTVVGTTPRIIYTCPVGKTAKIENLAVRTVSYGGNTLMNTLVDGNRVRRTVSAAVDTDLVQVSQALNAVLTAGQTISLTGDSGSDNGSMDTLTVVRETPI